MHYGNHLTGVLKYPQVNFLLMIASKELSSNVFILQQNVKKVSKCKLYLILRVYLLKVCIRMFLTIMFKIPVFSNGVG